MHPLHFKLLKHPTVRFFLALSVIALAAIAAYSNTFHVPFIFDDLSQISEKEQLRHLWPLSDVISRTARPVINLTFAFNYQLGGLDVYGYHVFNLCVHILGAFVLFGIVRRTFRQKTLRHHFKKQAMMFAFLVSLIWVIHPLQTEAVTYVIHRMESLMGLFYLLTLYCVIRGASSRSGGRGWYISSVIFCFLGMGSKEVMVTAPVVILIYDRIFLTSSWREVFKKRRHVYLCFFVSWVLLAYLIQQQSFSMQNTAGFNLDYMTPIDYAMTQTQAILYYLRLAFWPTGLCIDYGWLLVKNVNEIIVPGFTVLTLLGLTVWAIKYYPLLGFLGLWFFLILGPTSSFMPIRDAVVERRMYLPLAAVITLVVLSIYSLIDRVTSQSLASFRDRKGWMVTVFFLGIALALGILTYRRNSDYRTRLSIMEDTAKKRPENFRALNNLARELIDLGRYDEAYGPAKKALEISPGFPAIQNNFANILKQKHQFKEAEQHYLEAIRLDPEFYFGYVNYGILLLSLNRNQEALANFKKALETKPGLTKQLIDVANAYAQTGNLSHARWILLAVIQREPANARTQFNLANLFAKEGKTAEAVSYYQAAIKLNPEMIEAYNNLGMVFLQQGKLEDAATNISKAIELRSDYAVAYKNLAAAYFRKGQLEKSSFYLAQFRKFNTHPKAKPPRDFSNLRESH